MQRLKVLVLALMAVFAVSALVSATASAAFELAKILPTGEAVTFTGESGAGTLSTLAGTTVECKSDTSEGSFSAIDPELGPFHVDFKECTSAGGACTGLGEAAGIILVLGTAHLVVDTLTPALGAGVLFLVPNPVHFVCAGVLVAVSGQVLCLIKPVATKTTHFEIVCEQSAVGDPKEVEYWGEQGQNVKMGLNLLLTSLNEGLGAASSEKTTALILTSKEITIDA
jgi:hypothetical protein